MKTVVLVMMILVCFNYLLKQTYRKFYSVLISSVVCALFVGFTWHFAIEQSKSQITYWLSDASLMLDIAVILTLEVAIQMSFCILAAHIQTSGKVKPITIWIYRVLRWFPGVLIFPVLFSILVTAVFSLPGISFKLIAWSLAAIVFVVIPLGRVFLKWLLPEKEIRLELLFLSNALIAIMGVIATVNGQTAVAGISDVDWAALIGVMAFVVAGLIVGFCVYQLKLKRITNKIKNK